MTEDKREDHTMDALAHAMVPPAAEAPPVEPAHPSPYAQDEAVEDLVEYEGAHHDDHDAIYDGEVIQRLEALFPLLWLAMLTVVSVIGIYNAVDKLP
jgi:hypothetical protein